MNWTHPEPKPGRVGVKPIALLSVGLWLSVYLYFTVRSYFLVDNFWEAAVARFLNCGIGALLCAGLYFVLRLQSNRRFAVLLVQAFVASLITAFVYALLSAAIYEVIAPTDPIATTTMLRAVLERSQASPWVFLAWCTGYLALEYNERVRANELRLIELQALAADAQNRMLRYQVQPHFLFNTLTAISTLILNRENARAERMVMLLSRFLRYSLSQSPDERVTLGEEAHAQEQYLAIEQERFGERLKFVRDIDPTLQRLRVPSLILQPLVENSVKHAVAASERPVTVRISARREASKVVIEVGDDGERKPTEPGLGVGLENVRRRLEVTYSGEAEFSHGPLKQGGYASTLVLPAEAA